MYVIIFEDHELLESKVIYFDLAVGVENFLEGKINDHNYKIKEFTILYGKVLTPKVLQKTRVMVNPSK